RGAILGAGPRRRSDCTQARGARGGRRGEPPAGDGAGTDDTGDHRAHGCETDLRGGRRYVRLCGAATGFVGAGNGGGGGSRRAALCGSRAVAVGGWCGAGAEGGSVGTGRLFWPLVGRRSGLIETRTDG